MFYAASGDLKAAAIFRLNWKASGEWVLEANGAFLARR